MDRTRHRLDELKATSPAVRRQPAAVRAAASTRLEDVIGGRETTCHGLRCWTVETSFQGTCEKPQVTPGHFATPLHHNCGPRAPLLIEPQHTMVLDIETGGFAGTPVFLIGVVLLDHEPLSVIQFLARDYPEEEAILHSFARLAAARPTWVTFNGKSFDEPFLHDRATLHRVPLERAHTHVDVLHAARRQWRHELPNCRLGTLEQHILKRERVGDVPSSDVPDLFHHFVHTGNAGPLRPVLEHNQIDLVSCTELLVRLSQPAL